MCERTPANTLPVSFNPCLDNEHAPPDPAAPRRSGRPCLWLPFAFGCGGDPDGRERAASGNPHPDGGRADQTGRAARERAESRAAEERIRRQSRSARDPFLARPHEREQEEL